MTVNYCGILTLEIKVVFTAVIYHGKLPQYFITLAPGANITDILRAAFLYESFLCSFYVLKFWVCIFLAKGFWRKSCS
jgi:hypothetical protein